MADDGKKGRGSKPRVQGNVPRSWPGQDPNPTYQRTVRGKPQGPKQPRTNVTYGYNLYNQYGDTDPARESVQRNRPRTVSSRQASLKKPTSATRATNASGKNKTYQKPSVKGRTVAPTTSGMAGRGGRRATKKP